MDVLTPFRYCDYKELDADRELVDCGTFASHVLGGMSMCQKHGKIVTDALAADTIKLVRAADKGDSLGQELKDYEGPKVEKA